MLVQLRTSHPESMDPILDPSPPVLPGIFEPCLFSGKNKKSDPTMSSSPFIRPMHPKTEIRADEKSIQKVLSAGWVGQIKIHGHRAQIHIPAESLGERVVAYNRQGKLHKKEIPDELLSEVLRVFQPKTGWNVIDSEWIKSQNKLFIFDLIKHDGVLLSELNFVERWKRLPSDFISPLIRKLPLLDTLDKCMAVLKDPNDRIEGLVFKSATRKGFEDTSIVRCRLNFGRD